MKNLRMLWSGALIALLLAACGAPRTPEVAALLTDADLDGAMPLPGQASSALAALDGAKLSGAPLSASSRGAAPAALTLEAARAAGEARGHQDLGGWLAYVEQKGKNYAIRLVDLSDANQLEKRGDFTVYSGSRPIQSVAVSRDGETIAFVAQSKDGDYDLYVLDARRGALASTRTPAVNERDVSMSLDGQALAWQGGTPEAPSMVWYHDALGGYLEFSTAFWNAVSGLPLASVQPSISGDGLSVAFIERSGEFTDAYRYGRYPGLAVVQFGLWDGALSLDALTLLYYGEQLADPSLSYAGDKVLFTEVFAGTPFLSLLDRQAGTLGDLIVGVAVDHPHLTADGAYATLSAFTDAYLVDIGAGTVTAISPDAKTIDTATYWARGNFTAYEGRNDRGPFVRPDDGAQLSAEGRTVPYHVYEFRPVSTDWYAIQSVQDHDGYLNLYVDDFNPAKPSNKLLAGNDDWLHSWSESTGGSSRIVARLERTKTYYIVTSACGAPGSPCGPTSGYFQNLITDGATPPPPPMQPTQLPAPDNSRFNITLRFWNDSLTDAEKAVFDVAAARWEEVITGDLENIANFSLSEAQTTAGAPGIVGELDDLVIDAAKVDIDGPGGVLARAGAYYVRQGGASDFLPLYGIMEFDAAEFGPGGFFENLDGFAETIMHEMGHVLGISRSFWIPLGYISGNPANVNTCSDIGQGYDPRYQGPAGNSAWVNDYEADSPTVPIANTGGCGTADSHWREIYLQDELMTGYAQGGGEPLSLVTIGALADLGYVVNYGAADAWFIPTLPSLRQVSPTPTDYVVEFDFTSAYTGSRLGSAQAPVTPVDLALGGSTTTSGCEAADFAGFPAGNIALIQRGGCAFGIMAQNALAAGASAVLIGNQGNAPDRMMPASGTFGGDVAIVGVPISYELMVELATTPGVVVNVNTDTTGLSAASVIGPQALPRINWHLAEELIPLRGAIDEHGNVTDFGN